MLYSPLYQSIRMILFGALSLTGLSLSAAVTENSDLQASQAAKASLLEETRTITAATHSTHDKTELIDSAIHDHANTYVSSDTDIPITAIVESTDIKNAEIESADINSAPSKQQPEKNTRAYSSMATDPAIDNSRLKVSDDNIQDSLQRLAQYYQAYAKADKPVAADTSNKDTSHNKAHLETQADLNNLTDLDSPAQAPATKSLRQLGTDLRLSPRLMNTNDQRCEGQWVYPEQNSRYQAAINENNAAQNNGQANSPLNTRPNHQAPLFAESDYGYYDNIDYAELSGNVIINQGSQHIEADNIVLDLTSGIAGAQGRVLFTDQAKPAANNPSIFATQTTAHKTSLTDKASEGGLIGVADSLAYSTESGQTTAYGVAFASVPLQAHGYAKRLNRPNESQYELDDVMFSTCPPTNRKWQIEAKSIDLDTDSGRGKAYDTTIKIADVPVFYLPYFNFPIDDRRSSGFLLPNARVDSDSGLEIDIPYYLSLAPNYDATLNTHIYTNRNPMLSGEFRYLTENYGEGIFNGSYLPNDKKFNNEDRSSFFYDHYWASKSIPRLSADAKYSYVSDADYLNDFDTLGLSNNTLNLPRNARLNYYNDYIDGELKIESFQTLDAIINNGETLQDKDKPYSRLPQLELNYRLPWVTGFDITGVHDSAYFKKSIDDGSEAEKSGTRLYNKISAAYPLASTWGYIKPQLSLQHLYTSYDQDSLVDNSLSKKDGSQSVLVPQASIDAGLNLYKTGSPFGAFDDTMGGYQILNPRLKYTYSPYKNQNDIPNFNTRIASINYEQLFSDSWFLGHDRLQDLHALTPGINYRYIDATGVTRFDGSIAEQFYIDDGRVTLENQQPVFSTSSSGMVWDASAQPYNNVWVDISGALTSNYDLNFITTELRYQPSDNSLFNVGFVKRQRDANSNQLPLSAFTASAIFPMNNNWRVLAQGQYDYERNKTLDTLVGIDYEDCCLGFAVYGRRYYNDLNINDKPTQAIMAEIRLNGLGSGSSRLTRLLSDKVLGFEPVQKSWKD